MARVLVVDTDICGLGLCMKFMGQGNDVQLFSSTKSSKAGEDYSRYSRGPPNPRPALGS